MNLYKDILAKLLKNENEECFMKIEKTIRLFEDIGINGGSRHDFLYSQRMIEDFPASLE